MIDFYYNHASAHCRAVMMCATTLGLKMNHIEVDLVTHEHMEPWFIAINPLHLVPTIVDNGFILWESRAIMTYLVDTYGLQNDPLYPKDPKKRAVINQRLHFDIGSLNRREFYFPIFFFHMGVNKQARSRIHKGFRLLNLFLTKNLYVAGNEFTVADFAFLATVSTFEAATYDFSEFTSVCRWYNDAPKFCPGWKENLDGCKKLFARYETLPPRIPRRRNLR